MYYNVVHLRRLFVFVFAHWMGKSGAIRSHKMEQLNAMWFKWINLWVAMVTGPDRSVPAHSGGDGPRRDAFKFFFVRCWLNWRTILYCVHFVVGGMNWKGPDNKIGDDITQKVQLRFLERLLKSNWTFLNIYYYPNRPSWYAFDPNRPFNRPFEIKGLHKRLCKPNRPSYQALLSRYASE